MSKTARKEPVAYTPITDTFEDQCSECGQKFSSFVGNWTYCPRCAVEILGRDAGPTDEEEEDEMQSLERHNTELIATRDGALGMLMTAVKKFEEGKATGRAFLNFHRDVTKVIEYLEEDD